MQQFIRIAAQHYLINQTLCSRILATQVYGISPLTFYYKHQNNHFKVGNKVLLHLKNIKTRQPLKKFNTKYLGPFQIKKRISKLVYYLQLPLSMACIYLVFYINLLELWYKPLLKKNFYLGPIEHPKVVGKWYKVEAILHYKSIKNKL